MKKTAISRALTAKSFLFLTFLFFTLTVIASEDYPEQAFVNQVLSEETPPPGVIFTVREYDEDALYWVLPRVEKYMLELRQRFPGLQIAMLSHGDELISLSLSNRHKHKTTHKLLQKLVTQDNLLFHICGTMAHMNGLDPDDFPDYVDVVPYGPTQIEDYQSVGFELIDLELTW